MQTIEIPISPSVHIPAGGVVWFPLGEAPADGTTAHLDPVPDRDSEWIVKFDPPPAEVGVTRYTVPRDMTVHTVGWSSRRLPGMR